MKLPHAVRYKIYTHFLYDDFLSLFRRNFKIRKFNLESKQSGSRRGSSSRYSHQISKVSQVSKGRNCRPFDKCITLLRNKDLPGQFFDWNDSVYAELMLDILDALEPRLFKPNEVLFKEKQPIIESYFLIKGGVQAGFQVPKNWTSLAKQTPAAATEG